MPRKNILEQNEYTEYLLYIAQNNEIDAFNMRNKFNIDASLFRNKIKQLCNKPYNLIQEKKDGYNKIGYLYSINYDGIIDYLHKLAGIEDTSNSVERKAKAEELKNKLKTQEDKDLFVKVLDADNPKRRFDTTPQERAYITAYLQHFFNALINKSAKHFNIYEKSLNEVLSAFISGYIYATFDPASKQKYSMHDLALAYMKNKGLTPSKDLTLFSEMFWREELKK